jgi:hypothetical protein
MTTTAINPRGRIDIVALDRGQAARGADNHIINLHDYADEPHLWKRRGSPNALYPSQGSRPKVYRLARGGVRVLGLFDQHAQRYPVASTGCTGRPSS